jgi:hypothetical protein
MALGFFDAGDSCLRSVYEEIQRLQGLLPMRKNSFAFLSAMRQYFLLKADFFVHCLSAIQLVIERQKKAPDNVEGPFNAHRKLQ